MCSNSQSSLISDKMLNKDIDWSILAQCDFFSVEKYVQTTERPAMRTVKPMLETIFRKKLETNEKWRNAYEAVCAAYKNLNPLFSICYDNYGGYRLLYTGKSSVSAQTVFKRNPLGFVREIPEGVVTDLSIMSSERTGKQFILLGPIRFVNSDCEPNAEYDFSSEDGIIQLRVKRRIKPGDEIFVKYGPHFFEFNACLCRTCEVKAKEEFQESNLLFDVLLSDLLLELTEQIIEESKQSTVRKRKLSYNNNRSKARRIKGKELVLLFNNFEESPPSATESLDDPSNITIDLFESPPISCTDFPVVTPNTSKSSETVSDSSQEDPNYLEIDVSTDSVELGIKGAVPSKERASSPISSDAVLNFSISAIDETLSNSPDVEIDAISQLDETLFDGSNVKVQEASNLTELFCSKYNLSDDCSSSLFALVNCLLPEDNKFPSGYSHIRNMKKNFQENIRVLKKTADDCLCVLNFRFQLREIVKQNFSEIRQYAEIRKDKPFIDFCPSFCPPVVIKSNETIVFNLVVFSDGVTIKKSTLKKTLWPVWIQLADLPPKLRMARKNIVLAALGCWRISSPLETSGSSYKS